MALKSPIAFMRLALDAAREATHRTSPNPRVGCVLVSEGKVIAQGVTRPVGGAHAEVVALAAAGENARGADMFVTLEPCSHKGRTAPCTDAIIAAGVRKVYVGMIDPNPLVNGKGLRQLVSAGVEVQENVLADECSAYHASFATFIQTKRPHVLLKGAATLDGRIATASGDSRWITGIDARRDVHRLRAQVDAVMVGTETARLDKPKLTVRESDGADPIRVVLDRMLSLDPGMHTLGPGSLVFCAQDAMRARGSAFSAAGADVIAVPMFANHLDLEAVLDELAQRQVVSLMVEGGGQLHGGFIERGLAQEVVIYIAPQFMGRGRPLVDMPSAASMDKGIQLERVEHLKLGDDVRITGVIRYPAPTEGDEHE